MKFRFDVFDFYFARFQPRSEPVQLESIKFCLDLVKGHQPAGTKVKHVTRMPVETRLVLAALAKPGAAMV